MSVTKQATVHERTRIARALRASGRTNEVSAFEQGKAVDPGQIQVALYEEDYELLKQLRQRTTAQGGVLR